jgi:hypothetical protein
LASAAQSGRCTGITNTAAGAAASNGRIGNATSRIDRAKSDALSDKPAAPTTLDTMTPVKPIPIEEFVDDEIPF